jgi:hypothetical protein
VVSLNATEYGTLCQVVGDTPEAVIAVHLLQRASCSAYVEGEINDPGAIVIQPNNLPQEQRRLGRLIIV